MVLSIVLCALVLSPFAAAQYSSSQASTTPLLERGTLNKAGNRLTFKDLQLPELKGVWQNVGRETAHSVEIATANSTMPDCASDTALNSYVGLDYAAGFYYVLAGTGSVNVIGANQQRSTYAPNATLNGSLIVTAGRTGPSCTHFSTYIDLTTGELMAESLALTQWTMNTTSGKATRTGLNCELNGNEMVGCYTGAIATTGPAAASAPSVAISSIVAPSPRPADAIRTVTRNTYTCLNGECLRLAPKSSTTSPAYGG